MAAIVAAALVACGGSDPDADEDRTTIEEALLTDDDLPEEFEQEPVDDEADDSAVDTCAEVLELDPDEIDAAKTAETTPVQFQSPALTVRAQITAFESSDLPATLIDGFANQEFTECYLDAFSTELDDGVTLESFTVETLAIDADAVDAGTALLFQFDIGGTAAEARGELALVDRFAVSVQTSALAGDMDLDIATQALETMVERLPDT